MGKGLITFKQKGSFRNTELYFNRSLRSNWRSILNRYGRAGVQALEAATPVDSGKTAQSWNYGIREEKGRVTVYWTNGNEENGVCVALLLIYGHALRNGAYVEGHDFVSPAVRPVFDRLANQCWKEVIR